MSQADLNHAKACLGRADDYFIQINKSGDRQGNGGVLVQIRTLTRNPECPHAAENAMDRAREFFEALSKYVAAVQRFKRVCLYNHEKTCDYYRTAIIVFRVEQRRIRTLLKHTSDVCTSIIHTFRLKPADRLYLSEQCMLSDLMLKETWSAKQTPPGC